MSTSVERTPIREPKQKRSQETRSKIVESAYGLICTRGFDCTTSHQIAERAGVSVGTFYMYFRDKKTLLHEIAAMYQQQFCDERAALMNELEERNLPFAVFLRKVIEGQIGLHRKSRAFNRELKALYHTDSVVAELSDAGHNQMRASISAYIEAHRNTLSVENPAAVAFLSERLIEAVIDRIADDGEDSEGLIDEVIRLFAIRFPV